MRVSLENLSARRREYSFDEIGEPIDLWRQTRSSTDLNQWPIGEPALQILVVER
jgi:hypothetical protein